VTLEELAGEDRNKPLPDEVSEANRTMRQNLSRQIVDLYTDAYTMSLEDPIPVSALLRQHLDLNLDLTEDRGDLVREPQTELARYIWNQSSTEIERRVMVKRARAYLESKMASSTSMLIEKLVNKRNVHPAVVKRMVRANLNPRTGSKQEFLRLMHRTLVVEGDTSHAGMWKDAWNADDLRMHAASTWTDDDSIKRWDALNKWFLEHGATIDPLHEGALRETPYRKLLGPEVFDVLPQQAVEELTPAKRFPALLGGN
jgi:hypothetical protein